VTRDCGVSKSAQAINICFSICAGVLTPYTQHVIFGYSKSGSFVMFYYKPHYLTKELGELECQVIPNPPGSSVERAQDYKAYPCILKTPVLSRPRTMLFLAASSSRAWSCGGSKLIQFCSNPIVFLCIQTSGPSMVFRSQTTTHSRFPRRQNTR